MIELVVKSRQRCLESTSREATRTGSVSAAVSRPAGWACRPRLGVLVGRRQVPCRPAPRTVSAGAKYRVGRQGAVSDDGASVGRRPSVSDGGAACPGLPQRREKDPSANSAN